MLVLGIVLTIIGISMSLWRSENVAQAAADGVQKKTLSNMGNIVLAVTGLLFILAGITIMGICISI
jgi:hypothetical protein